MRKLTRKPINLAQPRLGAEVIYATDDFFAPKERLILPSDPVFIADKYDDNGKWMDGWESRRKRTEGYDHGIIRLGKMGIIDHIDLDTSHFTGNHAPAASLDACLSGQAHPNDADWQNIVPVTTLTGDSHNIVAVSSREAWTHLRLNIFPDGGVARLRVYGDIVMDWAAHDPAAVIDLAALEYGGRPIFANDEHFGILENIIAPGRGLNMGDGWETRRRRAPGHDWSILELAHPGIIEEILIDTAFFKGNYPDRCFLQAANFPEEDDQTLVRKSQKWDILLPEQKLQMDQEHFFKTEIKDIGPVTHIRLNIIPDGGISRLRLFGKIT
ncbi:MAG: allantoicase [Alphaproteobacteria bacterium]|nr:MAG: allantoicase [Alphaproteobacteria bacterium]